MAKLAKMKKIALIGQDNYGEIYKVEDKETHEIYAAKTLYVCQDDYDIPENIERLMSRLIDTSQNGLISFLKYYDYNKDGFGNEHRSTILTEYCQNGSLEDCIPIMNNTKKLINLYGIARAMEQLHEKDILHFNLTSKNVLEDENLYPKLKDFQVSIYLKGLREMLKQHIITIYTAPETLISNEFTKKSEVYAYGIILHEMIVGEKPFKNLTQFEMLDKKVNGYIPPLPENHSVLLRRLHDLCLDFDPENRPGFNEIVKFIDLKTH